MVEPRSQQSFSDQELFNSGHAVASDRGATRRLLWMEQFESDSQFQANRAFLSVLSLWQRGYELLTRPFMPDSAFDFTNSGSSKEEWLEYYACEFRLLLLAQGARASKASYSLMLTGYYSQCLALCRTIYETWKRVAFVRREPKGLFRFVPREDWIPSETRNLWEEVPSSKEPDSRDWERVFPATSDLSTLDGVDRRMLDVASDQIRYLHNHAHPTIESVTQLMQPEDEAFDRHQLRIAPSFSNQHGLVCCRVLVDSLGYLLYELELFVQLDDEWRSAASQWRKECTALKEPLPTEP